MNNLAFTAILLMQGLALQACLRSGFAFARAAQSKGWTAEEASATFAMFFWLGLSTLLFLASI